MGKVPMSQKAQRLGWRQAHSRPPPGQDIRESPMQQPGSQQDRAQLRPKCVFFGDLWGSLGIPALVGSVTRTPTQLSSVRELQAGSEQSKLQWTGSMAGSPNECQACRRFTGPL